MSARSMKAVALAAVMAAAPAMPAHAAAPVVPLPDNAQAYGMGGEMVVGGLPMQLTGFVAPGTPAQLAQWFRNRLGKPLVENTVGGKTVLGRAQDGYYLSVQLEAAAQGTRGIVAVSNLQQAYANRHTTAESLQRLLARFPSGTKVVSQLFSNDYGKADTHLVLVNTYDEQVNQDSVMRMMREDGLELEREAQKGGTVMFFKGKGREAIAVIGRDHTGRTSITLNSMVQMERAP